MSDYRFLLHRRARLAYHALTPQERQAMETAIAPLVDVPAEQWPAAGARQLAADEPVYLVRVDDSLRALVRPARGGQPEVLDVVRHETLQAFAPGKS